MLILLVVVIIAVVVLPIVIFTTSVFGGIIHGLSIFNGPSVAFQECVAQSGFACQNPVYSSGTFQAYLGQYSGGDWGQTMIVFVPYGKTYLPSFPSAELAGMVSGKSYKVDIILDPTSGNVWQGTIYANYTENATYHTVMIGLVSVSET